MLAEKYFDDMNNDVQISGKRHQQKSVDGFNRLPDVFTKEDVIRCFGYKPESTACFMKIKRMIEDNFAEKIEEGDDTGKYRKLNQMLI